MIVSGVGTQTTGTTKDFAERWDVDYAQAAGFLAVLAKFGAAAVVAKKPNPTGRGKGSVVYGFSSQLSILEPNPVAYTPPAPVTSPNEETTEAVSSV